MRWEQRLTDLFDDLEQQAEGLALAERDVEVAELGRAEYARVDLASRLHASAGQRVVIVVRGVGRLEVSIARLGADWLLADDGRGEWLVRIAALAQADGLSERAVHPAQRSLAARLGLGSALRGVADERSPVLLHRSDGGTLTGRIRRVGADFVELWPDEGGALVVVAFEALAAVRRTGG